MYIRHSSWLRLQYITASSLPSATYSGRELRSPCMSQTPLMRCSPPFETWIAFSTSHAAASIAVASAAAAVASRSETSTFLSLRALALVLLTLNSSSSSSSARTTFFGAFCMQQLRSATIQPPIPPTAAIVKAIRVALGVLLLPGLVFAGVDLPGADLPGALYEARAGLSSSSSCSSFSCSSSSSAPLMASTSSLKALTAWACTLAWA
mmetsp:Transcript_66028/g.193619  ORF Transcript_66028/g.193619 Transcript_66028/m.193619 type:complete len:208 (-) Transcript_66028:880-1503(-)